MSVIDWVDSVFPGIPAREMRGLEWGRLYETHHDQSYDPTKMGMAVSELRSDPFVTKRAGIWEYLLEGKAHPELLAVRLFDEKTKALAFQQQTTKAEAEGVSNCPLCAVGQNNNRTRIYQRTDMDADHVTAWSKGGSTVLANCEMLCVNHNRAKGNK